MEWSDRGIVLAARRHGETSAIASLLTHDRGRHAGLVRGGAGRRLRGVLQPGNVVRAVWRGRLSEHLGNFTVEPESSSGALLDDADRLACLASACAVAEQALPERHPYPALFDGFLALLDALSASGSHWGPVYVRWELGLLDQLGFGLDLSACAVTGTNDGLVWVSPRSGRAVSASAGEPYREKLLALPRFLLGGPDGGPGEVSAGLRLSGHFLSRHLFAHDDSGPPPARERFVARMARAATTSGVIEAP